MPAGIGIGQVVGLVREVRGLEGAAPRIAISGPGAEELAAALAAGGDRERGRGRRRSRCGRGRGPARRRRPDAQRERARPASAREGADAGDRRSARRLRADPARSRRRRRRSRVEDGGVDVDEVAAAIAASCRCGRPVARRAAAGPACPRSPRRLIATTAFANAALAASSRVVQPQLPLLTLAQARMLLLLGVARGETLPRDPERLAPGRRPVSRGCARHRARRPRGASDAYPFGGRSSAPRSPTAAPGRSAWPLALVASEGMSVRTGS